VWRVGQAGSWETCRATQGPPLCLPSSFSPYRWHLGPTFSSSLSPRFLLLTVLGFELRALCLLCRHWSHACLQLFLPVFHFFFLVCVCLIKLRQCLCMLPRLASNSRSSCLCLSSAVCHHTQWSPHLDHKDSKQSTGG
jgi:hypothetical protein